MNIFSRIEKLAANRVDITAAAAAIDARRAAAREQAAAARALEQKVAFNQAFLAEHGQKRFYFQTNKGRAVVCVVGAIVRPSGELWVVVEGAGVKRSPVPFCELVEVEAAPLVEAPAAPAKKAPCPWAATWRALAAEAARRGLNMADKEAARAAFARCIGRPITSRSELDGAEVARCLDAVKRGELAW